MAYDDLYRLSAHAVVADSQHRVLLIKSAYGSFGWELPGGALEPGETARECVERECGEELGQHISVGPLTGIYYHKVHNSHALSSALSLFLLKLCSVPSTPPPDISRWKS